MRWNWCFCAIAVSLFVNAVARAQENSLPRSNVLRSVSISKESKAQWFSQKLDHSNPSNLKTWWQLYRVNEAWFKHSNSSPIFLMLGGRSPIHTYEMVSGAWINYARKYGALCIQLEHRYYGDSQPTVDLSVENLKFLSSEQALGDIANFIRHMNEKYRLSKNKKWVVFGGGYSGSLAAWARLKYPHLIHAAVSSSPILLAKADFKEYNQVVRRALTASSPECAENVHKAALAVEDLVKTRDGADILRKKFKLCAKLDISNEKDVALLARSLASSFQIAATYNKRHKNSEKNAYKNVNDVCKLMVEEQTPLIDRYAAVKMDGVHKCLNISYRVDVQELRNTSYNWFKTERQWAYQMCTEIGTFPTSSSREELFGSLFNLQFYIDRCKDVFGRTFNKDRIQAGIAFTNAYYRALDIDVSRIVFVLGSLDPYFDLGIINSTIPHVPIIILKGASHCTDMASPSPDDPTELKAARGEIERLIGKWLN